MTTCTGIEAQISQMVVALCLCIPTSTPAHIRCCCLYVQAVYIAIAQRQLTVLCVFCIDKCLHFSAKYPALQCVFVRVCILLLSAVYSIVEKKTEYNEKE